MDWNRLYELQFELDERIMQSLSKSRSEIYLDKVLALMVEVGELANETRCFKYWSQRAASSREIILEEYVDGVHFILSLGLDYDYRYNEHKLDLPRVQLLTEGFHLVYNRIEQFKQAPLESHYLQLMNAYLALGELLSFSTDEVVNAYLEKNEENHQRQEQGY
ncbi:dUTP diphosphatase [Alkalibacillus silvisoli]|uniref:dUTP diphosphatase n=1 Tax=Alkalibacillus silvisoli TaxID=392823 RepID=A0ABN0ZS02_9BACI